LGLGFWGLGLGDWGLGPNPKSPIPNPQSPIPNPHNTYKNNLYNFNFFEIIYKKFYFSKKIKYPK
jgi:hypothetical protein